MYGTIERSNILLVKYPQEKVVLTVVKVKQRADGKDLDELQRSTEFVKCS